MMDKQTTFQVIAAKFNPRNLRYPATPRVPAHPVPNEAVNAQRTLLKERLNQWLKAHPGWVAVGYAAVGVLIVGVANVIGTGAPRG